MIFLNINIYNILFKIILVLIFCISLAKAQEDSLETETLGKESFPIAVVDMQRIVGQSQAAVKVREYIENKKQEFSTELKNEEEELKSIQEDLASQRSIMPPDEFAELESNFRS